MTNLEIARILFEMAALWEMEGVQFKPRAYEKAAMAIEALGEDLTGLYEREGMKGLNSIPNVGKGIAQHLEEVLKTGRFKEYERFKKKIPVNISELMGVEGIGPKTIKELWLKLGVRDLATLEKAALSGKIRSLPHFGEKSEQKILKGIEFLKRSAGRQVLGFVIADIRQLEAAVRKFPEVKKAVIAGSVRRRKETIGDIDILVVSDNAGKVMDRFTALAAVDHVYGKGPTKTNVKLKNGLDADLRVVPDESYGAALNYFTGSKDHNIKLREIAVKKGWKLNEYGLFEGDRMLAGRTEEELYRTFGLQYVEPELRENTGEIEAARKKKLPALVGYEDLKGDLQIQTDWTDGEDSIEEMAEEAIRVGLEYIAITDHTRGLAMTFGSDEKKLMEQMACIDALNRKYKSRKFRILKGAEVNIQRDGSLDIEDSVLAQLDVVGIAVHGYFNLSREEQTARVIRAMENPNADILFHPTSRLIQKRDPIDLDMEAIIETARRTGTILEVDSMPDRLDLKDDYVRKCVTSGVRICIDSDAHAKAHLRFLEFGIAQARRGWASKSDVINTLPVKDFLAALKH